MTMYTVSYDADSAECGITLDMSGRRLSLRHPRAGKTVDEFLLAEACRELVPVVIGSGCGEVLVFLDRSYSGPVAVVDKEGPVMSRSGVRERGFANLAVEWITDTDFTKVMRNLAAWQESNGGKLFYPLQHPSYMALERGFYLRLYKRLKESNESRQ